MHGSRFSTFSSNHPMSTRLKGLDSIYFFLDKRYKKFLETSPWLLFSCAVSLSYIPSHQVPATRQQDGSASRTLQNQPYRKNPKFHFPSLIYIYMSPSQLLVHGVHLHKTCLFVETLSNRNRSTLHIACEAELDCTDQMVSGQRIELSFAEGFWVNVLFIFIVSAALLSRWMVHILPHNHR